MIDWRASLRKRQYRKHSHSRACKYLELTVIIESECHHCGRRSLIFVHAQAWCGVTYLLISLKLLCACSSDRVHWSSDMKRFKTVFSGFSEWYCNISWKFLSSVVCIWSSVLMTYWANSAIRALLSSVPTPYYTAKLAYSSFEKLVEFSTRKSYRVTTHSACSSDSQT